ncbi:hypothetical protein [[Eubacterium] cellulosolvens]
MTGVSLIHKSDVSFDVLEPIMNPDKIKQKPMHLTHHGEIYIYLNDIFLFDGNKWYRANISDIKEIKSFSNKRRILIHFSNFDLIISCADYTHLLALRDFLFLAQQNSSIENLMIKEATLEEGG